MPTETPEKAVVEKKEKRDKKAHKSEKKRSREEDTVSDSGRKHKKSKRLSGDAELIDTKKEKKGKRKSKGGDEIGEEDGGRSEEKEHKRKKHNDDIEDEGSEIKEKDKKKEKKKKEEKKEKKEKKDKRKRHDDEIEDEEGEPKEMKKKHTSKKYSDEIEDEEVEKGEKNKKKKHRSKKHDEEIDDTEKNDKKKHKGKKHFDSKDRADQKRRKSEEYDDKSGEAMDVDTEIEAIDEAEDESVVEPEYEAIAATQEEARVEARRGLAAEFEDGAKVISDDEVVAETEDEAVAETEDEAVAGTEVGTEVGAEVETEDESEIEAELEAETAQSESSSSLDYKPKRAATDAMDLDEPTATTDIYQPPDIPADPQFPFFSQTVSLYVPIIPSGWDKPVTICQYGYLLNLQNQYVPSLRGVLMKYKNVALSANPSRVGALTTDDDDNSVLLRTHREYGVGYGYVTADVDLFVPSCGAWMEGSINLQTAGHIGVVCWGRFNAAIEARRLPPSWRWVAREDMEAGGTGNTTPTAGLGLDMELGLNAPLDEHGAAYQQMQIMGFWVDANGDKVKGRVRFRIRNFEVGVSGKTSYLSLEGTMLDMASEKTLMQQEAEDAKGRHEIEANRGTFYARRLASELGTTRFMSEEERKMLEERRAAAAEDRAAALEAEAAAAAIAAAAAAKTSAPKKRSRVVRKK